MISSRLFRHLIPAAGLMLILGAIPAHAASNPALAVQPEPVVISKTDRSTTPRHALKRSDWCGVRMVLMVGIAY
jgi:hypothetical protein